jgi:hypothetical protein
MKLKHLFTREADRCSEAALAELSKNAQAATESSKKLHRQLKKNGITLQISVATGSHGR